MRLTPRITGYAIAPILLGALVGYAEDLRSAGEATRLCESLRVRSGTAFATYATEHFVVLHDSGDSGLAARTGVVLEAVHDRFYALLRSYGLKPEPLKGPLLWILFTSFEDFDAYAREADRVEFDWLDGYYSARTNRVAFLRAPCVLRSPGEGGSSVALALRAAPHEGDALSGYGDLDVVRVTHEAAHQLAFNSGLQTRGVLYPLWVSEGLAIYLETDSERDVVSAIRHRRRTDGTELLPFERLLTLTRIPEQRDGASEVYAQLARLFLFFAAAQPEALPDYLTSLSRLDVGWRDEQSLMEEIVDAFGPPQRLVEEWVLFLERIEGDDDVVLPRRPPMDSQAAPRALPLWPESAPPSRTMKSPHASPGSREAGGAGVGRIEA